MPGADPNGDIAEAAREGVRRNGIGDFVGARKSLDDALRMAQNLPEEESTFWRSRLLVTLAYSSFELSGERAALDLLAEARDLAADIGSRRLLALAYVQECNILARATNWDQAIAAGDAAERVVDALEPEERFALHLNRGLARLAVLALDDAETDLDAALALSDDQGKVALRYKAIHNKGCLEYVRGDLPRALTLMREAEELPVDVARDRNHLDQAQVLVDAGLVDRARTLLTTTLHEAVQAQHRIEEGAIHLDLARCAILLGDAHGARSHARTARAVFDQLGARDRSRRASLVAAEVALAEGSTSVETEQLLDGWGAAGTRRPDDRTAVRLRAEVLLRRGALRESVALLDDLRRSSSQGVAAQLHEDYLRAATTAALGDRRRSRATCRRASIRFGRHQGRTQSLEVRAALALHARRLAEFDVAEALKGGHPAAIFASVERWRAGSLRVPTVRPSTDPQTARLMTQLRATQRARLQAEGSERAVLAERVAALTRRVERREWESERLQGPSATAAPLAPRAALQYATAHGSTVISLFSSGGLLHALVIDGSISRVTIGSLEDGLRATATLASDVRARSVARHSPAMLVRALEAAVRDSATRLDGFLFGEGSELQPPSSRSVVIVPTRSLASVPWNLLESLTDHTVVAAQSVTHWVRSSETESRGPTRLRAAAGPGLSHAPGEVADVVGLWGVKASHANPAALATAEDVVDALGSASVVHLAAHGTHEDGNPMFSSLRMADGPVYLHELPRPCRAEHVVLSACDVGRSEVRTGDEPLGLAAGLMALGARSIVSSVAPVDDEVARAAMALYHERLARGASAGESLSAVVAEIPSARTFCVYGSDWARV